MLKKIIKGVVIGLLVLGVVGIVGINLYLGQFDQVKLQYDKEVISSLKRELDFTLFENELKGFDDAKMKELDGYIFEKSIDEIQNSITLGYISCEDVALYYLNRIKLYDHKYNTVIQLNPMVLEVAKEQDKKLKNNEELGSLFGTVVLIKDNIAEKNMNTASGTYALRDLTTSRDAFIVDRLKSEGAMVIGKANLSEWSNYMSLPSSSGFSVLGGQTKNAYGKYDVGGSSSGSSVAGSLNFATYALGSETAGSMIFPAGQNSVVGLKPTLGLLSRDLIVPISEAQDTAGIIGKNVNDVLMAFRASFGYDENDPLASHIDSFDESSLDKSLDKNYLKGKKIGILKERSERNEAMIKELEALGAEVIEVELDANLDIDMSSVLKYGIVEDVKSFLNNPAVNTQYKSLEETLKYNMEDPDKRMPFGAKLHEEALNDKISKADYEAIVEHNRLVSGKAIDDVLKNNDIVAIVSFSNTLSGIYAPAMYPALTVPAGYKEDGEPLGVTFIGSLNDDIKLLNIGYCYEKGTNHRRAPVIK